MERYFIVFYSFTTDKGSGNGNAIFTTTSGYLSQKKTHKQILKLNKNCVFVVVTNIIELNYNDYLDYMSND